MAGFTIPNNFYVQQANRQVLANWDQVPGAVSYTVQRSTDNVTFTTIATIATNSYLDTTVTVGIQYWYQVAATNASAVTSSYTNSVSTVPTPTAEMSLGQIRYLAQARADLLTSNFLTIPEWNQNINQSMFELYDLLITADEEYYVATPAAFGTDGSTFIYPLPDGVTTFINGLGSMNNPSTYVAAPFYKLKGVDLALQTSQNAWVTVTNFNFIDRNTYTYPNTASTIYGVFNLRYRILGNNLELIPTPSGNQFIRLWYIPRLPQLLADTDITSSSISGWVEYVIIDAAIKAMQKEESDVTVLMLQKEAMRQRIMSTATNRDIGQPPTISQLRNKNDWDGSGFGGSNGPMGGW